MRKSSVNIAFAALFTAIIAILSQVSFITPTVPLTLQILGIALCGFVLDVKWSLATVITYLAVGALGLPVFSNFTGGIHILLGPTGGFIFGFIALAFFCSLSVKIQKASLKILIVFSGLLICHTSGVLQYALVTGNGIWLSAAIASLPFIIKDMICLFGAFFLSKYILKGIRGLKV